MSNKDQTSNPQAASQQEVMNPFPGLRPFGLEESHLFFGREGQSEEVLRHLSENRFVAVIGASGSGKSSLMYCGLVPILHGGFIAEAGSSWEIITTRPGNHPVENLAISISSLNKAVKAEEVEAEQKMNLALLQRSSMGLTEAIRQIDFPAGSNILLMVDQFEELFRYKKSRKDEASFNESEAFVKLLVGAVRQKEVPIYIVLTMRSDFIGDCSQFQDLTSLINLSNYLIPQMTRDDFEAAVTGPVAVGGATIDHNLVTQVLNDVGDNPDQLPILQHALMRTWDYWQQQRDLTRPLSISDYEAVGTMAKALSMHANEAFEELSPRGKQICESMFKTLTEKGGDNIGTRQPTRLEVVAEIARSEPGEVVRVIDVFRAQGRSFLIPAYNLPVETGTVVDISHESLMRIWDRLKIWVDEEAQAVHMYNRLSEAAELFQLGKTGLWRPPDLQLALNWKKKQQPTITWAQRYNPAFERTMVFLDTSDSDFIAEEQNKIRLQKRALRRTRVFASVLGTAAIISIGLMLWSFVLREQAVAAQVEANHQRELADSSANVAQQQEELARQEAENARIQKELADSSALVAIAQEQLARSEADRADNQARIAQRNADEAEKQRKFAVEQTEVAKTEQQKAIEASQEAYNRRMLSVAQSMAVKSLQVDNDTNLKALLAYQAYQFNDGYNGIEHNADVYSGLYDALKFLKGENYNVYKGHNDAVRSLAFVPGSDVFYSAGSDGQIIKWNRKTKESVQLIKNNMVNRILDISSDGKWMACGTDGEGVQLFNLSGGVMNPRYFHSDDDRIRTLDFSPDNQYMYSSGTGNIIRRWNLDTGKGEEFASLDGPANVLAVSRDGKYLTAGTKDGMIILWNTDDPSQTVTLFTDPNPANSVLALDFNDDGSLLSSGDLDGNVKIWDVQQMKMILNLRGHRARINNLKFSPGSKILASSSNDGTIRLWETENLNNQPIVLSGNEGFVFSIAFSPDAKWILTGSTDESRLVASPTSTKYMVDEICPMLDRNMSEDEWATYVGADIPYEKTCEAQVSIGVKKQ